GPEATVRRLASPAELPLPHRGPLGQGIGSARRPDSRESSGRLGPAPTTRDALGLPRGTYRPDRDALQGLPKGLLGQIDLDLERSAPDAGNRPPQRDGPDATV